MFWRFNLLTSHIETLLNNENVTLHELMDEDDILQECKSQNRKLLDFILRPEVMREMVNLVTENPGDDVDEKVRYKYPNTACELLTSDVPAINNRLADEPELLYKVYAFLENEGPLNPLLASFVSKIMGLLINRKSEFMLEFLSTKPDFISNLLRHLGTSAIMDLLLRLITCIESNEVRNEVIAWLNEQSIIQKLVAMIDPSEEEDKHYNASQSLCDLIKMIRDQMHQLQEQAEPDPLLEAIELPQTISDLLSHMLGGESTESVLTSGLAVIQTLLEYKRVVFTYDAYGPEGSSEQMTNLDSERMSKGVSNTLLAIAPRLKDLHQILVDPPRQHYSAMPTTIGILDPPLGNARLQLARLMSTLLLTNTSSINIELVQLGTINILLDLFFKYVWNNFLHTQVETCINTILNANPVDTEETDDNPLLKQLFIECKIVQRVIAEWEENDIIQSRPKGCRRGFMGHLSKIANDIVECSDKGVNAECIKKYIKELPDDYEEKWNQFVSETLAEANKRNTVDMVGSNALQSSSEDDDADFSNIPFSQDTAMQQLQQMTSNFIDQFGFNEEEFDDQGDAVDEPFKTKIDSIDFSVNADESSISQFEEACNQRIQQFDDPDSEELWEEKEITFSNTIDSRISNVSSTSAHVGSDDNSSSDSDEDLDSPAVIRQLPSSADAEKMDIDSNEAWPTSNSDIHMEPTSVGMDTVPEWDSLPTQSVLAKDEESWANFENATAPNDDQSWADFNNFTPLAADLTRLQPGPRSSSPVAMDTGESGRPTLYIVEPVAAEDKPICDSNVSPGTTSQESSEAEGTSVSLKECIATIQPSNEIHADSTSIEVYESITISKNTSELKIENGVSSSEAKINSESASVSSSSEEVTSSSSQEVMSSSSEVTSSSSQEVISSDSATSNEVNTDDDVLESKDIKTKSDSVSDLHVNITTLQSTSRVNCSSISTTCVNTQCLDYAEGEEDLADNFDFLASAGLMKGKGSQPDHPNNVDHVHNVPNDITIEQAREEAQQALAEYSAASTTTQGANSKQNGPV